MAVVVEQELTSKQMEQVKSEGLIVNNGEASLLLVMNDDLRIITKTDVLTEVKLQLRCLQTLFNREGETLEISPADGAGLALIADTMITKLDQCIAG